MKPIIIAIASIFLITSCAQEESNVYSATQIHTIPYGGSGILASGDYTGQGTITNTAGTTVSIEGLVIIDAISIVGTIEVPTGSTLMVHNLTNVGGGASLKVTGGSVLTQTFTQVGNTCVSLGSIKASGKFTIGGGTTLYLSSSEIEASELVIVGNVQAISNAVSEAANWFSVADLHTLKYLNRGGGTSVCGPLLFNTNSDEGASGIDMIDFSNEADSINSNLRTVYGLVDTIPLYMYNDNCTPLNALICN